MLTISQDSEIFRDTHDTLAELQSMNWPAA